MKPVRVHPSAHNFVNNNFISRHAVLLAGLVSAILACTPAIGAAGETVVFDNSTNPLDKWISATGKKEIGDEITLAGSARAVTSFVFEYFGDFAPGANASATALVRFYKNDGGLLAGTSIPKPGSLLWESAPFQVLDGFRGVSLSVPNVLVPDRITWSVEFNGLAGTAGNQAGLSISDPVSVGAILPSSGGRTVVGSYSDYWFRTAATADSWALENIDPGKANFYAKIGAVPEPGTVALFSVAGGFLFLIHRRQSR